MFNGNTTDSHVRKFPVKCWWNHQQWWCYWWNTIDAIKKSHPPTRCGWKFVFAIFGARSTSRNNASTTTTPQTGELRRKSTLKSKDRPSAPEQPATSQSSNNQNGRTPFTITKKLTRTAEKGFGFSIVWTHPPRIEKVEPGLSADRCGILPGDYVIFVDKHNVVTMPEMDILNLIKTQGNTLILEIFRRSTASKPTSNGVATRAPSLTNSAVTLNANQAASMLNNNDEVSSEFATPKQSTSSLTARPMTACSNLSLTLVDSTKRRLHLPQVNISWFLHQFLN